MKKIRKIALRLSVVALSFIVVLSFLSSTVQATGYYVVNCMIAHDEEWDTNAFWYYGYSGEELASIIFYEAGYYFGWHFDILFRIRAWRSWNSYDDFPTTEYFRDEVISETGFTQGMIINDVEIHLLIAFTDETFQDCYGVTYANLGVILVSEFTTTQGQHTDNILQHELTHLYGIREADEHCVTGLDCVMNIKRDVWCPFPDWFFIPHCMITNEWCADCLQTIREHKSNIGYWREQRSGGGIGDEICAWGETAWGETDLE